jgi:ribosome-binding factor A
MPGDVKRAVRVAGRLREELARELGNLRDPRLAGALISRVELTDDLQLARVYVRTAPSSAEQPQPDDERARRAVLSGLSAAAARLRRSVAQSLGLRYAPNLRFFYDEAPDALNRIEELLREIESDGGGSGQGEP